MNRFLRGRTRRDLMTLSCLFLCGWLAAPVRAGEDAEAIRRKLKQFQQGTNPAALDYAWPHLDSPDESVREAARAVVRAQPFEKWKDRALEEKGTWASLELLRALAESCPRKQAASLSPHVCEQITTLRIEQMDPAQVLAGIRLTRLVFHRLGPVTGDECQQMRDLWSHLTPPSDASVSREWRELIEFLRAVRPRQP